MKKYLNFAFAYAVLAMAGGVFYREFTKWNALYGRDGPGQGAHPPVYPGDVPLSDRRALCRARGRPGALQILPRLPVSLQRGAPAHGGHDGGARDPSGACASAFQGDGRGDLRDCRDRAYPPRDGRRPAPSVAEKSGAARGRPRRRATVSGRGARESVERKGKDRW